MLGVDVKSIFHTDYRELLSLGMDVLAKEGMIPTKFLRRDGAEIDVEIWIRELGSPDSKVFLIEARDITVHLETAKALRSREQRLEGIINTVADGIVTIDSDGAVQSFNAAAEEIFGLSSEEVIGHNICELVPGSDGSEPSEQPNQDWRDLLNVGGEIEGRRKDGRRFPMEMVLRELNQGNRLLYTGILRDISERKKAEERVQYLAHHDALTDLPNRFLFEDRLDEAIIRATRHANLLALLFLDLNKFKPVNDTYGHSVGDKILIFAATRLKYSIRASDTVARIGGDEFVIILEEIGTREEACRIAEKVADEISRPTEIEGIEHIIGISIGISLYPDHGGDAVKLIKAADSAMYEAKSGAGKSYRVYAGTD